MEAEKVKSIRDRQLASVLEILQLKDAGKPGSNTMLPEEPDQTVSWKVLVYDRFGGDVVAPLLKLGELREQGVTLSLMLHQERQPIPDAPAVYVVEPTPDNIRQICQDLRSNLYESYYFNFLSAIPRTLLEELAQVAVETETSHQVAKVVDQYLHFVTLDHHLFSLTQSDMYFTLNNPKAQEADIEAAVEKIVNSLFSVLVTMGEIPIIRCPRGNAAEMVAQKLDQKIRTHISNVRTNLFQDLDPVNFQRPLLILGDRNLDLQTMLHHSWNYQPLVHDLLGMKLNRVVVMQEEGGAPKKKVFYMEPKDFFWTKNAAVQFPQVAENVDIELNKYREEHEKVSQIPESSSDDQFGSSVTESLKSLVSNLPAMTEKKRVIDMHMNIATSLLKLIKERQIDFFVQLEETLNKQTKATILDAIKDQQKGTSEDKLRLFLVFYLTSDEISDADLGEYEEALKAAGCSVDSLNYLKQVKAYSRMTAQTGGGSDVGRQDSILGFGLKSLGNKWTDGVMDNAVQILKTGVKNLRSILPSDQALPLTRIVDALMEGKAHVEADQYLYFDPKSAKKSDGRTLPKTKTTFQSAIVFVVGGGNYSEFWNLQDYAQKQLVPKTITYGATDILTGIQFLSQLNDLGKNSQ